MDEKEIQQILIYTELIFEAGRLAGLVDAEKEREMEIIDHCAGHCCHRTFKGGSNVVTETRLPKSEKWRSEVICEGVECDSFELECPHCKKIIEVDGLWD